jgi:hypothetical protein
VSEDAEEKRLALRIWAALPNTARAIVLLLIGVSGGGGISTFAWSQILVHDHRELTKPQATEVEALIDRKIEQKLEMIRAQVNRLEATSEAIDVNITRLLIAQGVEPVRASRPGGQQR